jgi:prepilin-type N-terminal cleavage/methylation domain-containing protein
MMRRAARRPDGGFTLIEMMLAVMILGIVMMMLAGAFNAVSHGKVQAEDRLSIDHEGRAILWTLSNEFRDAVQTPIVPSRVLLLGLAHMSNGQPLDNVTISTLDLSHSMSLDGFGAEQVVTYTTAPNPQHPQWSLLMRNEQSALMLMGGPSAANSVVLNNNLLSLHIRYFDGSMWQESWDSASLPPGRQLPLAVAIDIVIADSRGHPVGFSTQVSLPMSFTQW